MNTQTPHFQALRFVQLYNSFAPKQAIRNIETELENFHYKEYFFPLSRNNEEYDNSYICSYYTAYISYAREELGLIKSKSQRWLLHKASYIAATWLKLAQINQTVCLNNWLFSTNPMHNLPANEIAEITLKLLHQNPFHSLSIRSLNQEHNGDLINQLQQQDWIMLPARQVYLFPKDGDWQKRNNVKNDQRLLRKTELKLVSPQEHKEEDFIAIEHCFNQLFIDKHSEFNPQFSADYLLGLHHQKLLEFFSFRDQSGKIIATLGIFTNNGIITAPIVGYDINAPKELGLYRLIIALLLKITAERSQSLNLSSGAGDFKRNRGGLATLEYTAIYCAHLPFRQRWLLQQFSQLLNNYAPELFTQNSI